jgi:hypothetical protein
MGIIVRTGSHTARDVHCLRQAQGIVVIRKIVPEFRKMYPCAGTEHWNFIV